ncbi:MAG: lysophospholipase L1-like esterase/dienelactone hydrolase [Limisphaerales bacterium]|jgi:lysophospholipase L1-like esterase/dienelactone hydrolase
MLVVLLGIGTASAREPLEQLALWDMARLGKAPAAEWGKTDGVVQEVFYAGEHYQGKPTRVFAYVGRPAGTGPFPGVVLAHGGGGQAFKEWARHWAKRGYLSIAMDTAGNGPGKKRHADGGPDQTHAFKFRNFTAADAKDMWTYHAVSDVILAHSLLRTLSDVDPDRTALTGISWGGYLTCLTSGIDQRFKASVPVYGCGFLADNSAWSVEQLPGMKADARRLWNRNFDPGQHVGRVTFPMLFLNGTHDFAYPLDSYRKTIEQVKPELVTVALHHKLRHGHIWTFKIVDAYIDSVLRQGSGLVRLGELRVIGNQAAAPILAETKATSAKLWVTGDQGAWQKRNWKTLPATIVDRKIQAELPAERPLAFFLQAEDERGLLTSTTHAELGRKVNPANHAEIPTPKLERDFYNWHARHAEILRLKNEVNPDIVLIGDSITHMWGGLPAAPGRHRGTDSWQKFFGDRALNLGFGWDRTQNVLWRLNHGELDGLKPKLIVIHIGTNNTAGTKNHRAGTAEEIAAGIRAVVRAARSKVPGAQIVLMKVFPRGEKPNHPARSKIAAINKLLPAIAQELKVELLDITDELLDENGVFPKSRAQDFLHPSDEGYKIWAQALKPFLPAR